MKKSIIICGTARSGTSMTCGILSRLGVHIPTNSDQKERLRYNPRGLYEHTDFGTFNKALIQEVIKSNPDYDAIAFKFKSQINKVCIKHTRELWGFKIHSVRTMDIFARVLENPHFIIIQREVNDHIKAIQAWLKFKYNRIESLDTVRHRLEEVNDILHNSINRITCMDKGIPIMFVVYSDIKHRPLYTGQQISKWLNIEYTKEMKKEITKFIDPKIHSWHEKDGKLEFNDTSEFQLN